MAVAGVLAACAALGWVVLSVPRSRVDIAASGLTLEQAAIGLLGGIVLALTSAAVILTAAASILIAVVKVIWLLGQRGKPEAGALPSWDLPPLTSGLNRLTFPQPTSQIPVSFESGRDIRDAPPLIPGGG